MKKTLDIVIPVYNEEAIIVENTRKILKYCERELGNYDYYITIANNLSTDRTSQVFKNAFPSNPKVRLIEVKEKGKGRAIMYAWSNSQCELLAYMDADLATDIKDLSNLLSILEEGKADIAIGTRFSNESDVKRSFTRNVVGNMHMYIMKITFRMKISDFYCGFKATSKSVTEKVFPRIDTTKWDKKSNCFFWDTEFLVISEKLGFKISEIPIKWREGEQSSARLLKDIKESLVGTLTLLIKRPWR